MNKLNILRNRDTYINSLLIICVLFQSYKLIDIAGYQLDIVLVTVILSNFMFFIYINKINKNIRNVICMLLSIYIMFNYLINYRLSEASSLFLSLFFILSIIFTNREVTENKFNKYIKVYITVTTILSIYAIYQIIARKWNLPLSDLYFEKFMVKGFNWTNPIWINGDMVYRSNAIYREPSFYSQFTALSIMFILGDIKYKSNVSIKDILFICINLIGMILSFSGTGFLILIPFVVYYFFIEGINVRKFIKRITILVIIIIFLIILINMIDSNNSLLNYFISRFNEILNNQGSGGTRFVGAYENLVSALKIHPIFGFGIGSREEAMRFISISTNKLDSTIPRIGVELGIVGIILWIGLILTFFKKGNMKNLYYRYILIFICVQMLNGDYFLQITNWAVIYFINCNLVNTNKNINGT